MAHGVEGRTPFLDPEVAAAAFNLPEALKIKGGQGKYLLRRWLETKFPEAEPYTKKRGFTVPVAQWISSKARITGELVAAQSAIQDIADPDNVRQLFNSLEGNPSPQARPNGVDPIVLCPLAQPPYSGPGSGRRCLGMSLIALISILACRFGAGTVHHV